ncbi:hypothetical protein [Psychroserpens sp. MEBiC05023]
MKLLLTLVISVFAYFGMAYYDLTSWMIWIALIIIWAIIDYLTYSNPFSWKDYTVLAILITIIEICSWYNYFGIL